MPNRDDVEGIGASASMGIDQSIDTLRLDEYDYVEDIKWIDRINNKLPTLFN